MMMHSDRRLLLKSLAAAGLALSGAGWAQAASASNAPAAGAAAPASADAVLALTAGLSANARDAALSTAFIAGVRSAASAVTHTSLHGLDSAPFQQLGQLLDDGRSTVLVGLLDDASATLVLDLVRSAGGRVLSEQQHPVTGNPAWAQTLGQTLALGQPAPAASPLTNGASTRVSFRCLI